METPGTGQKVLGWLDCASLIVGIMLGTGIFAVFPKLAAAHNPSTALTLLAWVLGTGVALCGAFCFAELAARFPHSGGEYVFLKEAYGRAGRGPVSFLFAWAQILVIRPASLVSLSIILAIHADVILRRALEALGHGPLPEPSRALVYGLTLAVPALFTATALAGVRTSRGIQNALTAVKVLVLAVFIGVGLFLGRGKAANLAPVLPAAGATWTGVLKHMGMALIPVMWVFGGWTEAPYIAADMKDPARGIPRALVTGILGLGLLYVLINFVYLLHLTPAGLASSWTFSSDLMRTWFGPAGEVVMAGVLVLSTAGAVNGLTVTGARMTGALAEDLGFRPEGGSSYAGPLLANLGLSTVLAVLVGCRPDSIDRLLVFTAGVVWIFSALVVSSLFVFRRRAGDAPYKTPLYPLTPLVFIVMCGYMLYGAYAYKPHETVYGIAILLAGLPAYRLGTTAWGAPRQQRGAA